MLHNVLDAGIQKKSTTHISLAAFIQAVVETLTVAGPQVKIYRNLAIKAA